MRHRNAEALVAESQWLMLNWMEDSETLPTLRHAVRLAQEVGMRRFEMVSRAGLASALRRTGARDEALAMARKAWRLSVQVGSQAFGGPLVLAEIAAKTPAAAVAEDLLRQPEAILDAGAAAHNLLLGLPQGDAPEPGAGPARRGGAAGRPAAGLCQRGAEPVGRAPRGRGAQLLLHRCCLSARELESTLLGCPR